MMQMMAFNHHLVVTPIVLICVRLCSLAYMFVCLLQPSGSSQPRGTPFESGGEDLPNAYRHVPMIPEQSWASIVTYWDPQCSAPRFRRYFGLLFGLPNAVCSFNRFPRMLQCFFRRLGFCMASMYFDDLTVQDIQSNKGSCQNFCIQLASLLGSSFSSENISLCEAQLISLAYITMLGTAMRTRVPPFGFESDWLRKLMAILLLILYNQVPYVLELPLNSLAV